MVVLVVLLIGGGIAAAIVLSGGSDDEPRGSKTPPAETREPEPTADPAAGLKQQVETLDSLMKRSARGRAQAVRGDFEAATASRADLVRRLQRLRRQVTDSELDGAVASFAAAVRESLRQNRECADACPTRDLERVGRLKETALRKINPLLEAQGLDTYRVTEI